VVAVLIACITLLTVPAMGAVWNISTVDSSCAVSCDISLALDMAGQPHIAYYDTDSHDLKYAWWDGSDWTKQPVKSSGYTGVDPSLALDTEGHPHIAYVDMGNDMSSWSLEYAAYDGSGWTFQTVDSLTIGSGSVSLALDAVAGTPHVSYYEESNKALKYAVWNGTAWENETVDDNGFWPEGRYTSLALNASGYPRISYFGGANDNLKYAAWDGSDWAIETVDDEADVGHFTSLALDADGHPHISYRDFGGSYLKYVAWDGSAWTIPEIVGSTSQYVSGSTSLALNASGSPRIAYGANSALRYAAWDGSTWTTETVDSDDAFSLWLMVGPSLALDAAGYPHIGYCNETSDVLMYAVLGEAPAAAFTGTPVSGTAPLTVSFTDGSTGIPGSWYWEFGDGTTSTAKNPEHPYPGAGIYTVNLTVGNRFGSDTESKTEYITVAPSVATIVPASALVNTTVETDLTGTGFVDGMQIALTGTGLPSIAATDIALNGGTALSCTFDLTGAAGGLRDVVVTSPAGTSGMLADGFAVTYPAPVLTGIDPACGTADQVVSPVTLAGEGFLPGATVALTLAGEPDIVATGVAVPAGDRITCTLDLAGAAAGEWDVTVTNPDTRAATITDAFRVCARQGPSGGGGNAAFDFTGDGTILTSSEGKVLRSTTIDAEGGIATLLLPQGTVALDALNDPITGVTIIPVEAGNLTVPDNVQFSFAGYAFECGPAGATFAPAITLTFTFSPDEWAALDGDPVVRFYDEETGAWEEVPSTVDAATHTVTATVSHFTIFALFSEAAAAEPVPEAATTLPPEAEETVAPATTVEEPLPAPTNSSLIWAPIGASGLLLLLLRRR
jgi:PKD repeat protein